MARGRDPCGSGTVACPTGSSRSFASGWCPVEGIDLDDRGRSSRPEYDISPIFPLTPVRPGPSLTETHTGPRGRSQAWLLQNLRRLQSRFHATEHRVTIVIARCFFRSEPARREVSITGGSMAFRDKQLKCRECG